MSSNSDYIRSKIYLLNQPMLDDKVTQEIKKAWWWTSKHQLKQKATHTLKELLFILIDKNYDISGGYGSSFEDVIVINNFDGMVSREYDIIKNIMHIVGRAYTITIQKYVTNESWSFDIFEITTELDIFRPRHMNIDRLIEVYGNNKVEIYFKI